MSWHYDNVERLDFDDACNRPDYHAVVSIQLCELANAGFFDLSRPDWDFGPKFSQAQHAQLCKKITDHYWYREISLTPPGIWKREFLRFMNEIMPKYMPWYSMLNNEDFQTGVVMEYMWGTEHAAGSEDGTESDKRDNDEYYKSRNLFSDFPQTFLAGRNQDYASNGNDLEYERIIDETINKLKNKKHLNDVDKNVRKMLRKDPLEILELLKKWDDVDATIIREVESMFSCLFTVNVNGY